MKCAKCNSENLKLEQRSKAGTILDAQQVALVCADCGAWLKWCSKEERKAHINAKKQTNFEHITTDIKIEEFYKYNEAEEFINNIGYSNIKKILHSGHSMIVIYETNPINPNGEVGK